MNDARLIVDEPAEGALNMARDEAMLLASGKQGQRLLRFYFWSRPTLSLGYFQTVASRATHAASRTCPLVRRATGGGAILHDRELTYSFSAPAADRVARQVTRLYDAFHESLVRTLAAWQVDAGLVPEGGQSAEGPPFLCFERRSSGDIVVDGFKVTGSAQRRQHGAVLQHGSVLLQRSPFAPELPGLEDLSGRPIDAEQLRTQWCRHLSEQLGLRLEASCWTAQERAEARRLETERYDAANWTARR